MILSAALKSWVRVKPLFSRYNRKYAICYQRYHQALK